MFKEIIYIKGKFNALIQQVVVTKKIIILLKNKVLLVIGEQLGLIVIYPKNYLKKQLKNFKINIKTPNIYFY